MTDESTDPLALAEAMMKERKDAIKTLAKLSADKTSLQEKISEIEDQETEAYDLAIAAGWSQSELKKIGFTRKNGKRRSTKSQDTVATQPTSIGQEVSA